MNVFLPRFRRFLRRLSLLILASSVLLDAHGEPSRSPIRALLLSGSDDHARRTQSAFLRELLESTGRFDVRVCETPVGLTADTLKPFDVIIDDLVTNEFGEATVKAIETFVESGKGYVLLRERLFYFASEKPVSRPGFAAIARLQGSTDQLKLFPIKFAQPEHPIVAGMKDGQKTADRIGSLSVTPAASVLVTDDAGQPLVFVSSHGKGRVFASALGSDLAAMQENIFRQTFARGTEWAGSGEVTTPPDLGESAPKAPPVRLMVITGGHDHETAFYDLFNDRNSFGWAAVSDSKTAFQQDLRGKYDVLVLYDFTRELDDKAKQNLRDFVEAGKGIVVLHHGILSYQKWPWWYEEVVGGLYRLSWEGDIPNSTVKFGEEHWITAAGPHPITDGITPFHVSDETYRGLFISPNIKPLLLTNNRTSDRTVAWIGPCATSKVVFIQLGHDHTPFRHPSYRALVHRSILWTAGKLN